MPFSSIHFIFLFLPVVLLLYALVPKGNWRTAVLVISSLVFFVWVDFNNLPLVLLFILLNYLLGLALGKFQTLNRPAASRWVMWAAVVLNLLILSFFKYLGLFAPVIQRLVPMLKPVEQPGMILGLSYFTFSALSYILDVYRQGQVPEKNILKFSAYLVMFPKLIQGPITLYRELAPQFTPKQINLDDLTTGIRRFIIGLAKKVILADGLAVAASRVFAADPDRIGAGVAWFGLTAYTLVIYFDFAGYTDMALGIGRMLGFRLPENFNAPYISRSIADFWRRWHMSLTAWFRTYVFIPLEYKRRKSKFLRQQINIVIVFLLTGLWHGAGWNFLIWGGYFGLILAFEASGFGKILKRAPRFFQHAYTLLIVMIGWVFFRITDLRSWGPFFGALFGVNGITHLETLRSLNILFYFPVLLLGVLLCVPLFSQMKFFPSLNASIQHAFVDLMVFGLFLLSVSYILSNGFKVFMYARF